MQVPNGALLHPSLQGLLVATIAECVLVAKAKGIKLYPSATVVGGAPAPTHLPATISTPAGVEKALRSSLFARLLRLAAVQPVRPATSSPAAASATTGIDVDAKAAAFIGEFMTMFETLS